MTYPSFHLILRFIVIFVSRTRNKEPAGVLFHYEVYHITEPFEAREWRHISYRLVSVPDDPTTMMPAISRNSAYCGSGTRSVQRDIYLYGI